MCACVTSSAALATISKVSITVIASGEGPGDKGEVGEQEFGDESSTLLTLSPHACLSSLMAKQPACI